VFACCKIGMRFILFLALITLAACGGGGASGGGGSSNAGSPGGGGPALLTLSPSSLSETIGSSDSIPFTVKATVNATMLSGTVYVLIVDNMGVITPNVTITPNSDATFTALMESSPSLSVGRHQGNIQVRLCQDPACVSQFPGSPVLLPYDLNVISGTNLTPLTPWSNVNNWETFQGNAAHTGYVPVTLDATKFSPRWRWTAPETANSLQPVVIANGTVYVTSSGYFATSSNLYALAESDRSTQWQASFGSVFRANPPAVSAGKVYAATSGHSDTFMWSFDASTGAQLSKTAFMSQWEGYYAPTIDSDTVYTNGGYYGGLNAFNFADGSAKWFLGLNQYDQWTPAVDASYAYAYLGESCSGCNNAGLSVINKTTGALAFTIGDSDFDWKGWSVYGSPVLGANNSVIVVNGQSAYYAVNLISFNTASRSKNWSIAGKYVGNPALANGVVYAINAFPYQLEARSESSGALLWKWVPTGVDDTGFYGDVVATDNMVFVSTNRRVYAVDLNTHQPAWSYWRAGNLAVSANGVLYIVTGSKLGAVNLK